MSQIVHSPLLRELEAKPQQAPFWWWLVRLRYRYETLSLRPAHLYIFLAGCVIFYLLITAAQTTRHLWHDELYTYCIAKAPSVSQLWREIRLDLNPPLIYLAERYSLRLFGDNEYSARIPPIIAFLIGSLCLYKFVADRLRPIYGILAMLVFWATPFEYFATEARPNGLIIGFFGLTILAWEHAIQPGRRWVHILWIALFISGMMCSHVLAAIYIMPFIAAELFRAYRSRRIDWAVLAAIILPSALLVINRPVIAHYRRSSFPAVTEANPAKLIAFFYHMLEPESLFLLLALCLGLVVGFRWRPDAKENSRSFTSLQWAFIWGLCLIPVLVTVAMMRWHGVAFPRYSGPAVLLYGILFAYLLGVYTNFSRLAALSASGILLLYIAGSNVAPVRTALQDLRHKGVREPSAIVTVHPELPLVDASGINFLELDRYADPPTIGRLYYLTGGDLAIKYSHASIFEGMAYLTTKFPIRSRVEKYQNFVQEHPRFLVLGQMSYPEDWLLRCLRDNHASLQYLSDFYGSQLYLVTMPGHEIQQA
jgi:Dolichyl-phosphate-mannose-protein mannosyltransferase